MGKFNIWKVLALLSFTVFVGCAATSPQTGAKVDNVSGTGDATSGAGKGTGGSTKQHCYSHKTYNYSQSIFETVIVGFLCNFQFEFYRKFKQSIS